MRAQAVVLAGLCLLHATDVIVRLRGAPPLGVARRGETGRVLVEHEGRGTVACLPAEAAGRCGLEPYARVCGEAGALFPCGPPSMPARRRLLVSGRLSVEQARLEDLEALPGVGPVLARRIGAARPLASVEALAQVKGVGHRRAASLAPLLGLDGEGGSDICSMRSWPTTSSACDRPP